MKVAYVPAEPVERDDALRIAARWVEQESHGDRSKVLVVVPVRGSVEHSDVLARIVRHYRWETTQTVGRSGEHADVVLAVWASADMLANISVRRPRSICVVQWREDETDDWLAAHSATDLSGTAGPARSAEIADPVARVAWDDAALFINPGNRLYQSEDRDTAVETLRLLHEHGHAIDPDELFRWAIAKGWPEDGAANLRKFAKERLAGRRHRVQTLQSYTDETYAHWKRTVEEGRVRLGR